VVAVGQHFLALFHGKWPWRGMNGKARFDTNKSVIVPQFMSATPSSDLDDRLGSELSHRLAMELEAALRRRPPHEVRLAGALRIMIPESEQLREAASAALDILVRRNTVDRPIYGACLRALAESQDERAVPILKRALLLEEGGGLGTLSAALFVRANELCEPLARLAGSRSPHTAFAAEVARISRGEADGRLLAAIAPRIKESHRIELCTGLFLGVVWSGRSLPGISAALSVLRDTERHLGRWLLLAQVAARSGDATPLAEAQANSEQGPSSAQAAWSLVVWALSPESNAPVARPTLELLARLSDRPSAERDLSFLFRMAEAGLASTKPMLESLVKSPVLSSELSIRAAGYLLRDYQRGDLERRLVDVVRSAKREPLRGLALAVLHDARQKNMPEISLDFARSRQIHTATWSWLVRLADHRKTNGPITTEPVYRRLQLGWLD
jgi:hypothetical protein